MSTFRGVWGSIVDNEKYFMHLHTDVSRFVRAGRWCARRRHCHSGASEALDGAGAAKRETGTKRECILTHVFWPVHQEGYSFNITKNIQEGERRQDTNSIVHSKQVLKQTLLFIWLWARAKYILNVYVLHVTIFTVHGVTPAFLAPATYEIVSLTSRQKSSVHTIKGSWLCLCQSMRFSFNRLLLLQPCHL